MKHMTLSLGKQIVYLIHQEEGHQDHVASWMEGCAVMVCLLAECGVRLRP